MADVLMSELAHQPGQEIYNLEQVDVLGEMEHIGLPRRSANGKKMAWSSGRVGQKNVTNGPLPEVMLRLLLLYAQDSHHSRRALRDGQVLVQFPGEV